MEGENVKMIRPGKGYEINYMKPCITDRKKILAEASLHVGKLGAGELCRLLEAGFENVKCSPKLRAARFNLGGKTVMVFGAKGEKKGWISMNVRLARDGKDVVKTVEKVAEVLRAHKI